MASISSLPARIAAKISVDDRGCWNWTGAIVKGYGHVKWKKKNRKAHRVVFSLLVGGLDDRLTIDHLCRNTRCVNPLHLRQCSLRENILSSTGACVINAAKERCPRCGGEYTHARNGWRFCKPCRLESSNRLRTKKYREDPAFRAHQIEVARAWRERNREKWNAYHRDRRAREKAALQHMNKET